MSNHFTITGRLGQDVELRFTQGGHAVANVRIVDQERRKNEQTGQWEDAGEPLWLSGSLWGAKAEALANVAHKGDLVTLTGKLTARSWDDKNTGEKRTATEVKIFDAAIVPKVDKPAQSGGWGGAPQQAPQSDPWGTPSGSAKGGAFDEPPF